MKNKFEIQIEDNGRGGNIVVKNDVSSFTLWWEFAGGNAIAIIEAPTIEQWEAKTGLPVSERDSVLNYIAEEVVARKAPGGYFIIDENCITIYSGKG